MREELGRSWKLLIVFWGTTSDNASTCPLLLRTNSERIAFTTMSTCEPIEISKVASIIQLFYCRSSAVILTKMGKKFNACLHPTHGYSRALGPVGTNMLGASTNGSPGWEITTIPRCYQHIFWFRRSRRNIRLACGNHGPGGDLGCLGTCGWSDVVAYTLRRY